MTCATRSKLSYAATMMRTDVRVRLESGGAASGATVASLDALTGALARAIDGLLAVDPDGVADGELAEAMLSLRREQARLAAVVAEQTAAFEARQVYAEDGSRSAIDWIAVHGRLPRGPVRGRGA